mmetsp:Transcript_6012/g.13637  ORF Transcript_6012/g.13637 Transcript_6012/m.13637 type:complete len:294 (+) Transcript_6012:113-994(+)
MSPTPKKIRSSSPDVIVAVGQGDAMREFECYKIALSFASPYFDAMLSTNMAENNDSRIEFPEKDPAEWELFYRFIDPIQIGVAKHDIIIHEKNAKILTPWFHEFQMEAYVGECDQILLKKIGPSLKEGRFDEKNDEKQPRLIKDDILVRKKRAFKNIIDALQFACIYDLKKTKVRAEDFIDYLLDEIRGGSYHMFDRSAIKVLVDLSLPLVELGDTDSDGEVDHEFLDSEGKSKTLWGFLERHNFGCKCLEGLSLETINNNEMLPSLVETFMQRCALEGRILKMQQSKSSITG